MTAPSLATLARRVLEAARLPRAATVVVACSGGRDSQVLLDVLAHVAKRGRTAGLRLVACGVDHGLRGEAAAELAKAEALAAARGVTFRKVELSVPRGANLQARAREARLAALRRVAAEVSAACIATGHHRDDRAETVVIRVLRGAPIEGLAVLPPVSHDLVRPLIHAPRSQIEAHARRRRLDWADDPSNLDRKHLRVRVRAEVLPLLRELDPRVDDHLVGLAEGASRLPVDAELEALAEASGARGRALVALRDAAREGRPGPVLLSRGRAARWDREGRLVITGDDDLTVGTLGGTGRGER